MRAFSLSYMLIISSVFLVWSAGTPLKRRRLVHAVRGPCIFAWASWYLGSEWFQIPAAVVCAEDIALWPYTPG